MALMPSNMPSDSGQQIEQAAVMAFTMGVRSLAVDTYRLVILSRAALHCYPWSLLVHSTPR